MPSQRDNASHGRNRLIADRYRLETVLGSGAMGTVWAGTDELLQRPVAVKELKLASDLSEEEAAERRERALREARAMALVTHPNVVMLYDVAWEGETPLAVMELVESGNLSTIVNTDGRLDQGQLALVTDGVAAALQAAHGIGIIHRDVKPGNVLLGEYGQIKLGDFGIARNNVDTTMTRSGFVLGTPAFIAPEAAVGDVVTKAADLWSLGAMLFAVVEGHLPYGSTGPLITISSIINGPVPVHRQAGPLGDVISGLMVKDPARRMPLEEVRGIVHPILPEVGKNPFNRGLNWNATAPRDRGMPSSRSVSHGGSVAGAPDEGSQPPPAAPTDNASTRQPPAATTNKPSSRSVLMRWGAAAALVLLGTVGGYLLSSGQPETAPSEERSSSATTAPNSPIPSTPVSNSTAPNSPTPNSSVPDSPTPNSSVSDSPTPDSPVPNSPVPDSSVPNAYSRIEAEDYFDAQGVRKEAGRDNGPIVNLGELSRGDWIWYQDVDFGSAPAQKFVARLASGLASDRWAYIDIRLDKPTSEPIGRVNITSSGGWQNWSTRSVQIAPVIGVHDVYLTSASDKPGNLVNLDWLRFDR